jgi:cellulose biosynthesis protein BcsQ
MSFRSESDDFDLILIDTPGAVSDLARLSRKLEDVMKTARGA